VAARTLTAHGAVSEEVAREMAEGALAFSHADVSVAITGVAGPTGGTRAKPVGLVYIAWAVRGEAPLALGFRFKGGRDAVRGQSIAFAIQGLMEILA
jgi:nicotinamide-nucleotide amidase